MFQALRPICGTSPSPVFARVALFSSVLGVGMGLEVARCPAASVCLHRHAWVGGRRTRASRRDARPSSRIKYLLYIHMYEVSIYCMYGVFVCGQTLE
jgi:hypothetical protein